jgi:hypothetical protein
MSKDLFGYTIPSLLRGLGVLSVYLERIQQAVDEGAFAEDGLLKARLAPDMLPLGRQIQIACDNAKNGPARLTGHNAPWFKDEEKYVAQYRARIEKVIAYVRSFTPRDFDGSDVRMIDQAFPGATYVMPGGDYVRDILLPNFHFHIATAHAILRHQGLSIGKRDYLGNPPATAAEIIGPTDRHRPIEFLTTGESLQWLARRGLAEEPIDNSAGFGHFQFVLQPLSVTVRELICALVEEVRGFNGGLLLLTDWIWDDEYDTDPTAGYREAINESRSLGEVPGFLFTPEKSQEASEILALVVERSWTGRFYLATGVTVLEVCNGYKIDVYTKDPDVERLIRYRLITLGAELSQP